MSKDDLLSIAANIEEGEQMFVLHEADRQGELNLDYQEMLRLCFIVVVKDGVFWVTNYSQSVSHVDKEERIPYVDRNMLMFLFLFAGK